MPKSRRFALRFLAIVAVILVVSLAFLHHSTKSGVQAAAVESPGGFSPLSTCANTACNTACWADGTHTNSGTVAVHTTNHGCTGGLGKCDTQSCF